MKKSIIYKALEDYQLYLQIDAEMTEESELNAVFGCKQYLEQSQPVSKEWLLNNSLILSKVLKHYHHILDNDIRDAKYIGDKEELERLRNNRNQLRSILKILE